MAYSLQTLINLDMYTTNAIEQVNLHVAISIAVIFYF